MKPSLQAKLLLQVLFLHDPLLLQGNSMTVRVNLGLSCVSKHGATNITAGFPSFRFLSMRGRTWMLAMLFNVVFARDMLALKSCLGLPDLPNGMADRERSVLLLQVKTVGGTPGYKCAHLGARHAKASPQLKSLAWCHLMVAGFCQNLPIRTTECFRCRTGSSYLLRGSQFRHVWYLCSM